MEACSRIGGGEAAYLRVEERKVGRDQEAGTLSVTSPGLGGGAVLAGWPQQETWGLGWHPWVPVSDKRHAVG